jgi:hypothetical protein
LSNSAHISRRTSNVYSLTQLTHISHTNLLTMSYMRESTSLLSIEEDFQNTEQETPSSPSVKREQSSSPLSTMESSSTSPTSVNHAPHIKREPSYSAIDDSITTQSRSREFSSSPDMDSSPTPVPPNTRQPTPAPRRPLIEYIPPTGPGAEKLAGTLRIRQGVPTKLRVTYRNYRRDLVREIRRLR